MTTTTLPIASLNFSSSSILNGTCQMQQNPCSPNGLCLQISATQFACQCQNNYTGILCQIPSFSNNMTNTNPCQCINGGTCLSDGTCVCSDSYRGRFCQLSKNFLMRIRQ